MRRRYFNNRIINNKIIIYTSSDNLIVVPRFYNFSANIITNTMNNNIGKITFDDSVTEIGQHAFSECYNLTSIIIPESVTKIDYGAFLNCTSLKSITIPESVTEIGERAFEGCTSLKSITIPEGVVSIGRATFRWCISLTSVYCKATTPPALGGTHVFYNNDSGRKIYVPTESVEAYKSAAYWNEYASAIVGYDF